MTAYAIPQPQGMTFGNWAARVTEAFASEGVAAPGDETMWQDWARSLQCFPLITSMNVPTPEGFPEWGLWADRFMDALR